MGKAKELIKIVNDPMVPANRRLKALEQLATLGTGEAIKAIGERARDPLGLPVIQEKALHLLGRKGS